LNTLFTELRVLVICKSCLKEYIDEMSGMLLL
jgi:hypothetical protein